MSKSDTFEADILKLIFNATAIANLADNAATSPFTTLGMALHTADPGETGTQTTSEATSALTWPELPAGGLSLGLLQLRQAQLLTLIFQHARVERIQSHMLRSGPMQAELAKSFTPGS